MNTKAFKSVDVTVKVERDYERKVYRLLADIQYFVPESKVTAVLQSNETPNTFEVAATIRPEYPDNPGHCHVMRLRMTYNSRYNGFQVIETHFEGTPKNCDCYDSMITAEGLIDQIHRSVIMADE